MKDYKILGKTIEITLDNGKVVKCATDWANKTIKLLGTDMEDVLLMWLEDNDYLTNDEQEELNQKAKENKVKIVATDKAKKKTQKERVAKPQPEKEYIIGIIANLLENTQEVNNILIENKAKLITFEYKNHQYKLDLVQKREKKV